MTVDRLKIIFIKGVILLLTFFPTYLFSDRTNVGQQILFVTFPFLLFFFIAVFLKDVFKPIVPKESIVFIFTGAMIYFTILSKIMFLDFSLLINHMRFFGYYLVFILFYNMGICLRIGFNDIKKAMYFFSSISLIFIGLQILFPDFFLVELISHKPAIDYLGFRIGGPLEWTYIYTFIAIPIFFGFLFRFQTKSLSRFEKVIMILLFISVILSQSKSAYINFIISLIVYMYLTRKVSGEFKIKLSRILLITTFFISVFVMINWEMFSHIINFVTYLQGGSIDGSTQTRFTQLQVLEYAYEFNPLMGYPIKDIVIENAYGHYFYNYGLIGASVFFLYLFILFINVKGFISNDRYDKNMDVKISILLLIISAILISASGSPIDAHKSSYIFLFFIANFFSSIHLEQRKVIN